MKLQEKRSINAQAALDRKTQIDEGLTLVKKIEALRSEKLIAEGTLSRFRKESIAAIQIEIDEWIRRKDELIGDVARLEERRKTAQIPLDAEWGKLRIIEQNLVTEKTSLLARIASLEGREKDLIRKEQEVHHEQGRAEDFKQRAAKEFVQAEEVLEAAHETAADMRNKAQEILSAAELKEKVVARREREAEDALAFAREREGKIEQYEIGLARREQELKEGWKNLQQTAERITNGNL